VRTVDRPWGIASDQLAGGADQRLESASGPAIWSVAVSSPEGCSAAC